jgi:hypothetical protein
MLPFLLFLVYFGLTAAFRFPDSARNILPWKRSEVEERQPQPTCPCLSTDPDTTAFWNHAPFAAAASAAPTPTGYISAYTNGQTYQNADGYLGFTTIEEYDSTICASLCDSIADCASFEICKLGSGCKYSKLIIWSSQTSKEIYPLLLLRPFQQQSNVFSGRD